jgi:hypothetical protein
MPRYLMNPATGSVDTEDNWRAEMPDWEDDQQVQFDALVEVACLDGNHWHEMDVFANYMDDEIREALHSSRDWSSEQEFLDAYVEAHADKFDGEEFTVE